MGDKELLEELDKQRQEAVEVGELNEEGCFSSVGPTRNGEDAKKALSYSTICMGDPGCLIGSLEKEKGTEEMIGLSAHRRTYPGFGLVRDGPSEEGTGSFLVGAEDIVLFYVNSYLEFTSKCPARLGILDEAPNVLTFCVANIPPDGDGEWGMSLKARRDEEI